MKVIINGDDFGYSVGQNLGILECFKNGIMTSTSLMVNMPGFNHAIELMKKNKNLNVGLHLVMTVGNPVSKKLKTIVNEDGAFDRTIIDKIEEINTDEIRKEYKAQLGKFLETGFKPTHIDFHYAYTDIQYKIAIELAKSNNIPMRAMDKKWEKKLSKEKIKYSKNFISDFYGDGVSIENLINIFEKYKYLDFFELMTHPAYVDGTILKNSSYTIQRAYEVDVLTSNEIKTYLSNNKDIELISYLDL